MAEYAQSPIEQLKAYQYPPVLLGLFSDADTLKLVELHAQRKEAYTAAFDARAIQFGWTPSTAGDFDGFDIDEELEGWGWAEPEPDHTVTVHLERREKIQDQIELVLEKYRHGYWRRVVSEGIVFDEFQPR